MARSEEIFSLLVGVTQYDALPESKDLAGPAADVELLRATLVDRFGVKAENIRTLQQSNAADARPTYANIVAEFERLSSIVSPGDQVVILLSGHGSQDLNDYPGNANDREWDGLDEVFLPSDMAGWNANVGHIEKAIRDDQIAGWLTAIRQRGAAVFFISDSCHSDTQTRAFEDPSFKSRGVKLLPPELLPVFNPRSRSVGTGSAEEPHLDAAKDAGIVALYAAQSSQETPDSFRDPETGQRREVGLLTYTVCQILRTTTQPLTFRELGQRVRQQYKEYFRRGIGADVPTPAIEGTDLDRDVLGTTWRDHRSHILFTRRDKKLTVTTTSMDGTLPGTILRLYPAAGEPNADQQLGWAVIEEATMRDSVAVIVDYSTETEKWTAVTDAEHLPLRGRCEIESQSFGALKLRVAVSNSANMDSIRAALNALATRPNSFVVIDESGTAPLRLSTTADHMNLILERIDHLGGSSQVSRFNLGPLDGLMPQRLESALRHVVRVESLRDIARQSVQSVSRAAGDSIQVSTTLQRRKQGGNEQDWSDFDPAAAVTLRVGEEVRFCFNNLGRQPVRVTALYVGDDYRILPLYPWAEGDDNRLAAGSDNPASQDTTKPFSVDSASRCLEDLIVLATRVQSQQDATNFSFLAQSPLNGLWTGDANHGADLPRASTTTRGQAQMNPLEFALSSAVFEPGATRGSLGSPRIPDYSMNVITWNSVMEVQGTANSQATNLLRQTFSQPDNRPWRPEVAQSAPRGISESVYPKVAPAVVVVRTATGHGTGFFISNDGWILTNHHVVDGCSVDPATGYRTTSIHFGRIEGQWMQLADQELTADIYKSDEAKDLALLKLRELPGGTKSVPFITLAEQPGGPGTDCVAIGHPASGTLWTVRSGELAGTASWPKDMIDNVMGQLSAIASQREELREQLAEMPARQVVISTCGLNPGDSGGPLVDSQGRLLAITFAIPRIDLDEGVNLDKFSYHIQLDEVKAFIANLPTMPLIEQPTPWIEATNIRLADINSDGIADTIALFDGQQDEPTVVLFDLDQDTNEAQLQSAKAAADLQAAWDAEFAMRNGATMQVFYDTDNDGKFDLVLSDSDQDGFADSRLVLSADAWQPLALTGLPLAVIGTSHFVDKLAKQFASSYADALQFLGGKVQESKSQLNKKE